MSNQIETGLPQTGTRMQAAEFYQLPESNRPIQLLDGVILATPMPVPLHQRTIGNILMLLDRLTSHGQIFLSPLAVYFDEDNVPEPDIFWVAEHSRCVVTEKRVEGPPDLIVEVLSPSTARYDKTSKFLLYEKYGVQEYWLVDADVPQVEVWQHDGSEYTRQGVFGPGQSFASAILNGAKVEVSAIFKD